jgi:hypothetical protein
MHHLNREHVVRISLVLIILLGGMAMIPYIDMPQTAFGWKLYAGIYTPDLDVNAALGAPGSVFAFTGSNYPANSAASIYVNGEAIGVITTDNQGMATFVIDTRGAAVGVYNVTMEVNINATATESFTLEEDAEPVSPPAGFTGVTFYVGNVIFLPVNMKE